LSTINSLSAMLGCLARRDRVKTGVERWIPFVEQRERPEPARKAVAGEDDIPLTGRVRRRIVGKLINLVDKRSLLIASC